MMVLDLLIWGLLKPDILTEWFLLCFLVTLPLPGAGTDLGHCRAGRKLGATCMAIYHWASHWRNTFSPEQNLNHPIVGGKTPI
jgi:hypothetical protein